MWSQRAQQFLLQQGIMVAIRGNFYCWVAGRKLCSQPHTRVGSLSPPWRPQGEKPTSAMPFNSADAQDVEGAFWNKSRSEAHTAFFEGLVGGWARTCYRDHGPPRGRSASFPAAFVLVLSSCDLILVFTPMILIEFKTQEASPRSCPPVPTMLYYYRDWGVWGQGAPQGWCSNCHLPFFFF